MVRYTDEAWRERLRARADLSSTLVHLTRPADGRSAVDVLITVLVERRLKPSDPAEAFMHGTTGAVCLQDAPLFGVTQNIEFERKNHERLGGRVRYHGTGLMFAKDFVYRAGGRPVIYEDPAVMKALITDQDQWWRFVNLNLSSPEDMIDWMHEREWRVPGELRFELNNVAVVLHSTEHYREFMQKAHDSGRWDLVAGLRGVIVLPALLV